MENLGQEVDHLVKRTAALGWTDTLGQSSQPVEDAEEVPDTILVLLSVS